MQLLILELYKLEPFEQIYLLVLHAQKAYETLLTKEEFVKVEDCGNYFRIPSDNRDLNYAKYFTEGEGSRRNQEEYNSDNTNRINIEQVKKCY